MRCQRHPGPDEIPSFKTNAKVFDDASFRQFDEWDVRIVPRDQVNKLPGKASQQQVWFRHRDPLPDDPVLHICALAYLSDLTLLGSAQVNHPEERKHLMIASLDHAMWFMRPFRADEWLLYDQSSPSACGGRALTQGKLFNQYGEMVASVMQEGLTPLPAWLHPVRPGERPGVGVLALQGDTREHLAALNEAGAQAGTVRRLSELESVDGLVIPGGESTAMSHLLREFELLEPLRGVAARRDAGLRLVCGNDPAGRRDPGRRRARARGAAARWHRYDRAPQRLRPSGRLLRGGPDVHRHRRPGARGLHPGPVGGTGGTRGGGAGHRGRSSGRGAPGTDARHVLSPGDDR